MKGEVLLDGDGDDDDNEEGEEEEPAVVVVVCFVVARLYDDGIEGRTAFVDDMTRGLYCLERKDTDQVQQRVTYR